MESFQELGLPAFLAQNLKQMNFTKPTPVQAQAIPAALEGKDVIASAQTGTGKTAAFGIPLLNYLENHKDKGAIILTPTRELAVQVLDVLRKLSGHHPLGGSVLLIGGAPMGPQLNLLSRKPRLIIGTPGRVIDHLRRGSLSLGQAGFLVLDEADRMLDMGFEPQLEEIRKRLQTQRQTLLFSATMPSNIQEMGARYLKDPVRIIVGSSTQPVPKISQMVIYTSEANKPPELMGELNERQGSVLVFARTQHRVDRITDRLKEQGVKVTRIHGGRTQSQRRQAIEHFREGHYRVLVATDIAARGLDIHHIAHVINYDLPRNPEDYIHRVGRTARAGAEGNSLCFLTGEDRQQWDKILRLMKATKESIQSKPSRFGDQTPRHTVGRPEAHPKKFNQGPRPGQRREGGPRRFEGKPFGKDNRSGGGDHRSREHRPSQRPNSGFEERRPQSGGSFQGERRPQSSGSFQGERPRQDSNFKRENTRPAGGGFGGERPRQGGEFNRFQKDRGFEKPGSQKQRHPDGRHQKRSDQHHRPTERPQEAPKQEGFEGGEERQPMDNRSAWERQDKNPFFQKKSTSWKGGQGTNSHRPSSNDSQRRFGDSRPSHGPKRQGFKPRPHGNGPRQDRPKGF